MARYSVYRYKYNIYPKLNLVDEYPPCLQIEPTSICNFRCVMCFQIDQSFSHKSNGFMGLMSMDIFKKTIDEIAGKIEAVTFASRGEPTLHKNFVDMLNYCEGKLELEEILKKFKKILNYSMIFALNIIQEKIK